MRGPGVVAAVDLVAQRPVRPRDVGTDVPDGGEPGQQRHAGILAREHQLLVHGAVVVHAEICGGARRVRQVRVHVDQARQAGVARQVEHPHTVRNRGAGRDLGDSTVDDHDGRRAARPRPTRRRSALRIAARWSPESGAGAAAAAVAIAIAASASRATCNAGDSHGMGSLGHRGNARALRPASRALRSFDNGVPAVFHSVQALSKVGS